MCRFLASLLVLAFVSAGVYGQRRGGGPPSSANSGANGLGALHFRPLGPEGNRVASITGVPGDAAMVYVGAADGGIWKTTDAGINWRFDNQCRVRTAYGQDYLSVDRRYCAGEQNHRYQTRRS